MLLLVLISRQANRFLLVTFFNLLIYVFEIFCWYKQNCNYRYIPIHRGDKSHLTVSSLVTQGYIIDYIHIKTFDTEFNKVCWKVKNEILCKIIELFLFLPKICHSDVIFSTRDLQKGTSLNLTDSKNFFFVIIFSPVVCFLTNIVELLNFVSKFKYLLFNFIAPTKELSVDNLYFLSAYVGMGFESRCSVSGKILNNTMRVQSTH